MNIPIFSFRSSRDPEDSVGRINRALDGRNHRLSAGLSISDRFDSVRGALVVTQGNGRYIRVRHVVDANVSIPKPIREGCLEFITKQNRDVGQLAQLLIDLAETQSAVVEQLKCLAGKYLDRVLAVAVCDPGYWEKDFDGRVSYSPMCDATRLAELSGVSVIDAFPAREMTVGGRGTGLEALPLWMIFADRNQKLAVQTRMLLNFSRECTAYVFPASDGLDADVPAIQTFESVGFGFLDVLTERFQSETQMCDVGRMHAEGNFIAALRQTWETAIGESAGLGPASGSELNLQTKFTPELVNRLIQITEQYIAQNANALPDVIHTAISWTIDWIMARIRVSCPDGLDQVFVSSDSRYQSIIIERLKLSLGDRPGMISPSDEFSHGGNVVDGKRESETNSKLAQNSTPVLPAAEQGVSYEQLDAVVAAVLGLFHIDQMPANVPWLTGADGQRILGRLTPGRPSNWRQLLRVMADFHPAPMKLKDAI